MAVITPFPVAMPLQVFPEKSLIVSAPICLVLESVINPFSVNCLLRYRPKTRLSLSELNDDLKSVEPNEYRQIQVAKWIREAQKSYYRRKLGMQFLNQHQSEFRQRGKLGR
jgi:hypothetical protein